MSEQVSYVLRPETLFAGIRKPIHSREELLPRIQEVRSACGDNIQGPLTHIFRYDTPVEGYDSEIGYPVRSQVSSGDVRSHNLRKMHFFSLEHRGTVETIRETSAAVYQALNRSGLSPELELMEIYHHYDPEDQAGNRIEIRAAFLAWPEVYLEQLQRVLGPELAADIWQGGEKITPFTLVDDRVEWVGETLERLKNHTSQDQQFEILSRVALVRPTEGIMEYQKTYQETGDISQVIEAENKKLKNTPSGGLIDPWWMKDNTLHISKVAYNRKAYDQAQAPDEIRRAYCFCALIREAADPRVDPIFCYRAAGWARQFWEPILGKEFKRCTITHSILKGDRFCAWDYDLG